MNWIAWLIIACEIAFWVVILIGLVLRYFLHHKKLGFFFLALTPVVDLILLAVTSIDLLRGATATWPHALAAVYISVSLIFGKSMIAWADVRFRYYVAKQGEAPLKRYGKAYAHHYFKSWLKHLLSWVVGALLLYVLIWVVGDTARTEVLTGTIELWSVIVGIDLLIALSHYIWPKSAPRVQD